jgi:predicted esterase
VKERQELLQLKLHEEFEECSEKEFDQKSILYFLGLGDDDKSLASRAVTAAFPSCQVKRVQRKDQTLYLLMKLN